MKYKLINLQTNEETICTEIELERYKYYVSDENPNYKDYYICSITDSVGIRMSLGQRLDSANSDYSKCKKVIATTNHSIDIPKVVDEVEVLAKNLKIKKESIFGNSFEFDLKISQGFVLGYNKAKETHLNSDEDMIKFGKWLLKEKWFYNAKYNDFSNSFGEIKTTKEILELWKEQQPKIVYYNE